MEPAGNDGAPDIDVAAALAGLTDRQRQVIGLHYLAGLPVVTVAALLEVSEGTVKSTLHDARVRLRRSLDSGGGEHD